MAPRFAAASSIRSDNRLVRGQFAGAARPSGRMTFGQESTTFRLQISDEIPDTDRCIILVALVGREPTFDALSASSLILACISVSARRRSSDSPTLAVKALPDNRKDALQSSLR